MKEFRFRFLFYLRLTGYVLSGHALLGDALLTVHCWLEAKYAAIVTVPHKETLKKNVSYCKTLPRPAMFHFLQNLIQHN